MQRSRALKLRPPLSPRPPRLSALLSTLLAFVLSSSATSLIAAPLEPAAENARVKKARAAHQSEIAALFREKALAYPPRALILRAFKSEGLLELWADTLADAPAVLIKTYAICARSGALGPKRQSGDGQVPEGFYRISLLNSSSHYHLSLRVDYPNEADRRREKRVDLGGDIFVHGDCVTIGCIPIQDGPIEELFVMAQDVARKRGEVDIHIFPSRLDDDGWPKLIQAGTPELEQFWENLREGYLAFARDHRRLRIRVAPSGRYQFSP